ncbi:hypothetical protein BJF92_17935 [Rhizobium rhizosphaerae]|uniref:YfdX protein n=1 Tax=Xaviernesmea rhizosphaerae TaxID=1672749 RepID=A0A1Q9ADD8_9HYPH|nr:YfdX family protein [Xaviernesmea rhizosphaerae]OLP52929.1 hypothetical protein BJF92_17935 [Xaviernesmea rhizosphaerae]OQP87508.1 hypothetical protein BTR14_06175 [Xaviernesmea rhizosphaerae]
MKIHHVFAAVLLATTAVGGAYAADQAIKPETTPVVAAERVADKDVGKLSQDGAQAIQDVHAARLAIFNADPQQAKTLIHKADAAIEKAQKDDAVYLKAEAKLDAKLNQIADKTKPAPKTVTDDPAKEIAWLPIDGQLTLGEDFVSTPAKADAIKKANDSVQKGDRKGAIDTLKLAGVDVNFTMAVLPLDKTVSDIQQATSMIDSGKFYEANALLKGTEDRMRFDIVDVTGVPVAAHQTKAGAPANQNAAATPAKPETVTK